MGKNKTKLKKEKHQKNPQKTFKAVIALKFQPQAVAKLAIFIMTIHVTITSPVPRTGHKFGETTT